MNKESLPDFSGKCISLRVQGSKYSHDLINPHFEYQGGKLFIIGVVPDGTSASGWDNGKECGVDWESVRKYTIFDDEKDYQKRIAISDKFNEEDANKSDT